MRLQDFPPNDCRNFLLSILWRYDSARERWPQHLGISTTIFLAIDEARLIWASGQWLKRYYDWYAESGNKIGVYPAKHGLKVCSEFMIEKAASINKDDPFISISNSEMSVIESCQRHLEHYEIIIAANDKKSGHWKKR